MKLHTRYNIRNVMYAADIYMKSAKWCGGGVTPCLGFDVAPCKRWLVSRITYLLISIFP